MRLPRPFRAPPLADEEVKLSSTVCEDPLAATEGPGAPYLVGRISADEHDREVIAHAMNKRFVELGSNHPVPYSENDAERPREEREQ